MSLTINFGTVGIYNEEFPSIKLSNPLITWPFKFTCIILPAIPLLPKDLRSINLAWWLLTIGSFNQLNHTTL